MEMNKKKSKKWKKSKKRKYSKKAKVMSCDVSSVAMFLGIPYLYWGRVKTHWMQVSRGWHPLYQCRVREHGSVLYREGSDTGSVAAIDGLYYALPLIPPPHTPHPPTQPPHGTKRWGETLVKTLPFILKLALSLFQFHTYGRDRSKKICLNVLWCGENVFFWGWIGRKKQKSVSVPSERALHAGWPMTDEHRTGIFPLWGSRLSCL